MYSVFGMSLSGNCHKVKVVLEHLQLDYIWHEVDILSGATRTDDFLARNPVGKVPVLELPDGQFISESNAIIQYLANGTELWPEDRLAQSRILQWMFFEQNRHEISVAEARFIKRFLPPDHPRQAELEAKHKTGHEAFRVMEARLQQQSFLVTDACSLADIALFAYTHVADEGGFDMRGYSAINAWVARLLAMPGFSHMGHV